MATDDVLELTDGATTIDLLRGPIRLAQDAWAPRVARRAPGYASGAEWLDVEEELRLEVVAEAGDNVGRLWGELHALLDQGRRWRLGDPTAAPVALRHRPAGSRMAGGLELEAPVYGGEAPELHESYSRLLEAHTLPPAPVTILRGGLWLNPTAQSAATGSQTNQSVSSAVTMPAAVPYESPTEVCLRSTTTVTSGAETANYVGLIVADSSSASAITMVDATTGLMSGSGTFTAPADTTARGGAHLRVATASTSPAILSYAVDHGTHCDVLVYCRSNRTYRLQLQLRRLLGGSLAASRADLPEVVTRDDDQARLYYLGRVSTAVAFSHGLLLITPTSATSGRIDIDTIVICRQDLGRVATMVGPLNIPASNTTFGPVDALQMLSNPLAYAAPRVGQGAQASDFGALSHVVATRGPAALFTRGSSIRWQTFMHPGGAFGYGDGRQTTVRLAVRRYPGYLVAE